MSDRDSTVHVGGTHRFRNREGLITDITINLSGIPVTASDEHISQMMSRAYSGVGALLAQFEETVRQATAPRLDPAIFEPAPAQIEPSLTQIEPDSTQAHPETADEVLETLSIPSADEVEDAGKLNLLGVCLHRPNPDWMYEPITDEGGKGQLKAVNTALSEAGYKGPDRFYPLNVLLSELERCQTTITSTRELSKFDAHIVLSWFDEATEYYRAELHRLAMTEKIKAMQETGHFSLATELALTTGIEPGPDSDSKLNLEPDAIQLSGDQTQAIQFAIEAADSNGGRFLFITGKAGTGKSTVLREIRRQTTCIVCAPTALAAINVGGQTIHRFFGLGVGIQEAKKLSPIGERNKAVTAKAKLIIIDEISMVRADVMDAIDIVLRKTFKTETPFAGKTIVAIGDMWQLEPVCESGPNGDAFRKRYVSPFWFDAKVFGQSGPTLESQHGDRIKT